MPEPVVLSGAEQRALNAIKRPVMDAARAFGAIRERLTDLAPRVLKVFNQIAAEHGTSFIDFCRMLDPTIPTHAAERDGEPGYRVHRTYMTLQYMRRLTQTGGRRGAQGVRDSAVDALARTLATVLQIVSDPETIWRAVQTEFQYSERLMTRLRRRVEDTRPLIKLEVSRPARVGNVIHMERQPAPAEGEALAQPGRTVEVPTTPARRARKRAA